MNLVLADGVELRQRRNPEDKKFMITEKRDIGNKHFERLKTKR